MVRMPPQALMPVGPLETRGAWDMMVDPRYNTIYYYNNVTGEAVWHEPPGWT